MLHTTLKNMQSRNASPNRVQDEQGIALLMVIICSLLFMLMGLSMTFSSLTDFSMSNEYEARAKALLIADAGFDLTQAVFRGNGLTALLSATTEVDQYLNFPVPTGPQLCATSKEIPFLRLRPFRLIMRVLLPPSGPERSLAC